MTIISGFTGVSAYQLRDPVDNGDKSNLNGRGTKMAQLTSGEPAAALPAMTLKDEVNNVIRDLRSDFNIGGVGSVLSTVA